MSPVNSSLVWQPSPSQMESAVVTRFIQTINQRYDLEIKNWQQLHAWSVAAPQRFWREVWTQCGVVSEHIGETTLQTKEEMLEAVWFPQARLNFAANLLKRRDEEDAVVFWREDGLKSRLSWRELHARVMQCAQALKQYGVGEGDRVAAFVPNIAENIIAMLATAMLGAIWTSCSSDFGVSSMVDRFGQTKPKVLFCTDGYLYKGKRFECLEKVGQCLKDLPSITHVVVIEHTQKEPSLSSLAQKVVVDYFESFMAKAPSEPMEFESFPFNHPLYILYSSGTTGQPKCIVHGSGGTLLQHLKEHQLHGDLKADDRIFFFTTCGWMMWNWLVSALASGATIVLYDGNPFQEAESGHLQLFDLIQAERLTHFGISAKFLAVCEQKALSPRASHDLSHLRTIFSTGSPLSPETFDYVYNHFKADVCLASISGGTDIVSCFFLNSPLLPLYRGELQTPGLGMDVQIYDEQGKNLQTGCGELVCCAPFPSMPLKFWNDPNHAKYRAAYFERFGESVWHHGDFVERQPSGGVVIHGRSDTTLNPGGVRIGTAEIYRQIEKIPEILESIVVAQYWPLDQKTDIRIVLFVVLVPDTQLDGLLQSRIKSGIREHTTARHVPEKIIQVLGVPKTHNGKLAELAVKQTIHGQLVRNLDALENPQVLECFIDLPELLT